MKGRRGCMLCVLLALSWVTAARAAGEIEAAKLYPSLASQLTDLYLETQQEPGALAQSAVAHPDLRISPDGSVLVWVVQTPGMPAASVDMAALARLGGRIAGMSKHFLEAWIPIDMLPRVADEVAGVTFLRPPMEWQQDAVTSEGVNVTGAAALQALGLRGAGAKVAVVDVSFGGLAAALSAGELPSTVITQDFSGDGMEVSGESVHGTACGEIVYDMVPEAQLYLVRVDPVKMSSTEDAVNYCIAQGIDVMSWSLGTVSGNFLDGQGALCDLMNNAYAQGVLPIFSAGNYASNAGDAHSEGTTVDADNDLAIEFAAPDDEMMAFGARAGQTIDVWLTWNGWPVTSEDYDLYILDGSQHEMWSSTWPQTGTQPAVEGGDWTPSTTGTYYFVIKRHSTATHTGIKYELYVRGLDGGLEYPVAQSSLSSPADAVGVIAVGAIGYQSWTTGPQEAFSSQGPTNDGRVKPELCGPDAVHTYSYGAGRVFVGTSAATPHVAGAAALIKSVHPAWTAAEVRDELMARAVDMGDPGPDNIYGHGRLSLPLHSLTLTATANPAAVVSGGNTALSALATDSFGHGIASYTWSDGGAGGSFSPSAAVANPTYAAPDNLTLADVTVTLSVTVVCDDADALSADDSLALTVHPHYDFPDVPYDYWSFAQVEACYRAAIVSGYLDGSYQPTVPVTRDQMAVYIARAVAGGDANMPTSPAEPSFTDVPSDHWAYRYIEYCASAGIVQGYADGSYQPGVVVTRDQMAVYISRATVTPIGDATVPEPDPGAEPTFTDVAADYWAYRYIEYCAAQGVVQGYSDGRYQPTNPVTRDQMAVYVARGFGLLPM